MDLNRNDPPNNKNNPNDSGGKRPKGNILLAILITVAVVIVISMIYNAIAGSKYKETDFNDFLDAMEKGQLSEVVIQSDRIIYMTKEEAAKPERQQKACYTGLPRGGDYLELSKQLDGLGVKNTTQIVEDNSGIIMILYYALMIGGVFLLMNSLTKRMSGDGLMGGFG